MYAAALALALLSAAAPPPDTSRFVVLSGGQRAGSQATWREPDGEWRHRFEYNDRGRGPKLETRIRYDARGLPTELETVGADYFKKPVSERFSLRAGRAEWRNAAERGEAAVAGPAWYAAVEDASHSGALVRALLASPDRSLPLLPGGRVRVDSVGELRVRRGGGSHPVAQYALSGFGFEPQRLWLDADRELVVHGSEWFALVREGWEEVVPQLLRAQEESARALEAEHARTLAHRPAGPVVIRDVAVFDAETGTVRPGSTVVVSGDRIRAVGPAAGVAVPPGATVIDGTGKTLLPGLWDMHTHPSAADGLLHLAAGVTTVRDMANDTATALRLRKAWAEGTAVGPRLVLAGFIDGPGPYTAPIAMRAAETEAEARALVRRYAELGYEQIKVYSSLKPELVPAVVDEAHRRGLRVSGHVPWGMRAEEAVRAGFDELQHANFLFLNFLSDTLDTRTPARFVAPAREAAGLDLDSPRVREFIRLLAERGVEVDPTLTAFQGMLVARAGAVDPTFGAVAHRLPPLVRRGLMTGGLPVTEGMDGRYRDSFRAMLHMVARLHRAGVPLVAGTDNLAGFALHSELELYARAGIPAPAVLQLATLGSARVTGRDRELGSVAPGKLADLVLVAGDPATRIEDLRRVELVLKDGVIFRPDELYRAVGVAPADAAR